MKVVTNGTNRTICQWVQTAESLHKIAGGVGGEEGGVKRGVEGVEVAGIWMTTKICTIMREVSQGSSNEGKEEARIMQGKSTLSLVHTHKLLGKVFASVLTLTLD